MRDRHRLIGKGAKQCGIVAARREAQIIHQRLARLLVLTKTPMGDTKRQATSGEVLSLRKENGQLKELVADLSLKNVVLKKSLAGTGGDLDE